MDFLVTLQYTCFMFAALLATILIVFSFFQNDTTREYRMARRMLVSSMTLLAVHFVLQIKYEIRANSDELASMFNILFYTPAMFLCSCSSVYMGCSRSLFRRYLRIGSTGCVLTTLLFFLGWLSFGRIDEDGVRYVMHCLFLFYMGYYIYYPIRSIRRNIKRMINDTGGDISIYVRYMWSSYMMFSIMSSVIVLVIIWRPGLYVAAPILLLALLVFVVSFVALGFRLDPINGVLSVDEATSVATFSAYDLQPTGETVCTDVQPVDVDTPVLSASEVERVEAALDEWIAEGNYRNPDTNIGRLSQQVGLSHAMLSTFFCTYLQSTFRIWLSDIRFNAAQQLIKEHPEYSNDTISTSCGFSSRSQLYKIFSDRVGMSPREWGVRFANRTPK